jgi:formylglycine-generating enzyme required for sulfatase activity
MVKVPEGDFIYDLGEIRTIEAFFIDVKEVTAEEYMACVEADECEYNGSTSDSLRTYENNKDNHPMNYVDWYEAVAYCTWKGKRLPVEMEWEKAARWTDGRIYPWGNQDATCDHAVMFGCDEDTQPVGSKESGKSIYGVYDMAGNVSEWTGSWFSASPTSRVLRGGSIHNFGVECSKRKSNAPTYRSYYGGFRCVQ